jgi:hypothetical protein
MRHLPAAAVAALIANATSVAGAEFLAGGYSFSDELGGFRLLSAEGTGSPDDPIVIVEEIEEVAPVTLVIRNRGSLDRGSSSGLSEFTLVKQVVNRSKRVWAAFELELQETLRQPSLYGDGLSFKQFAAVAPDVSSDSFSDNERFFEPYDRIEFRNGHVDPESAARFKVTITDPTPVREFYLVQDPMLLSAEIERGHRLATASTFPKDERGAVGRD